MEEWHLNQGDLKEYPHFDSAIPKEKAEEYATDKSRVAQHTFYPFISYRQRWTRFARKGEKGRVKERPIRYAARRDAYIFSYYRYLLSRQYEAELSRLGLDASILAYRRIRIADGEGGKCNIHFANDAFLKIRQLGNCCVIALDISGYFESLDHAQLKSLWCRMLGVNRLPDDHFQVFKAITQYAVVDKERVYERLGHFGEKRAKNGNLTRGYFSSYRKLPKHLCSPKEFREKIAGFGDQKSIIEKNYRPYGIPQGAPISDLLANLYLIDFDMTVAGWVRKLGGAYFRYSDDILIVISGDETVGRDLMEKSRDLISKFGAELKIKKEKSSLYVFHQHGALQKCQLLHGTQGKNGLEYLGFRYDGKRVYLRDATLSNLRRKVARAAYCDADACARRYPDKVIPQLKLLFNYERLIKRFGKVEDFDGKQQDYNKWTFWTYAARASKVFGKLGKSILRQLRNQRTSVKLCADKALERAVIRRERRKSSRPRPPLPHVAPQGVGTPGR